MTIYLVVRQTDWETIKASRQASSKREASREKS